MNFNPAIRIGNSQISTDLPAYIIAEVGVNHGSDMTVARQLVDIAVEAGANAVKFQAFRTENLILQQVEKAPYQKGTTSTTESQFDMLRKLELTKEQYTLLQDYCRQKGICFLITPFDECSLSELEEIGVEAYKVASTDTTNLPFLKKVAQTGKPIILSTGMCYLEEIRAALQEIYPWNRDVILLQCTANYPIQDNEANLRVIDTFKQHFDILVGYSDHSVGIGAAPYAVPMGAKVVEKHFTLDKDAQGPDHLASLNPVELREFVRQIRRIENYMGTGLKMPTISEAHTRTALQKCLVAARPIMAGEPFSEENLIAKRTGGRGISPIRYRELLGRPAAKDYRINDIIEFS